MACEKVKRKIYHLLKDGYFNDEKDFVDVSDGSAHESVHIVVVSRKFKSGMTSDERGDLIDNQIWGHLPLDEWSRVFLTIGRHPEEVHIL